VQSVSDNAMIVLQTLARFGGGESGSNFALMLQDSKESFDSSTGVLSREIPTT
jgi:hypothetical protein